MASPAHPFSDKPSSGLLVVQAVGITASTYLFGQNAGISFVSVPAISQAPASLAASQWTTVYAIGHAFGPPLAIISALATGYVAYHQDPSSTAFQLNVASTIIVPSIVPFTLAFMKTTNDKLFAKERLLAATLTDDEAHKADLLDTETALVLLKRWALLNLARAAIVGTGAMLAIWAAIDQRAIVWT